MFKRILLAVDGSSISDLALTEAVKLAREQQAELRIVHVVDRVTFNMDSPIGVEEFWEAVRKSGQQVLESAKAAAQKARVEVETKLLEVGTMGQRVAELVSVEAEEWPADLIVIGTHGRRGFSHLLLGSVAESVIRIATKPVLLVRSE